MDLETLPNEKGRINLGKGGPFLEKGEHINLPHRIFKFSNYHIFKFIHLLLAPCLHPVNPYNKQIQWFPKSF